MGSEKKVLLKVKGGASERGVWELYVTFLLTHDLQISSLPLCMLFSKTEMAHRDMVCLVVHNLAVVKGHFGLYQHGEGWLFLSEYWGS